MKYRVDIISDRKGMKDFLDLPYLIYRDDPNWVAPLRSEVSRILDDKKNPYFKDADLKRFVCYRDGAPVARAITVINKNYWIKQNEKTAFFGFFEALKDHEAFNLLLNTMEKYCMAKGTEFMEGPFNPNHYSEIGILTGGETGRPVFFENYNPEYYSDLLKNAGFKVVKLLHNRRNRNVKEILQRVKPADLSWMAARGFTVRPFSLIHMRRDLEKIREVNNDAFKGNWMFLPLSKEEYDFSARFMLAVTRPWLVRIVEHNGRPVGVLQCVLNINPAMQSLKGRLSPSGWISFFLKRKKIREILVYTVGVRRAYQGSPVFMLLIEEFRKIVNTYPEVYTTWMTDDNHAVLKVAELLGLEPFRYFEIYGKQLTV